MGITIITDAVLRFEVPDETGDGAPGVIEYRGITEDALFSLINEIGEGDLEANAWDIERKRTLMERVIESCFVSASGFWDPAGVAIELTARTAATMLPMRIRTPLMLACMGRDARPREALGNLSATSQLAPHGRGGADSSPMRQPSSQGSLSASLEQGLSTGLPSHI